MKNRSIIARMLARNGKRNVKKVKAKKVTILAMDPESNENIYTFSSFKKAKEMDFDQANIAKAAKGGTKYKGHLWEISE